MLDQFDPRLDADFRPGDAQRLADRLTAVLPPGGLLTSVEAMRPYETDGLAAYRSLPGAVVLPRTVEQVQAVMRICSELGVPVVARGAGTGLSGGALPFPGCVLISLARFSAILDIDPRSRTARVQPGVRNLAISEAAPRWACSTPPTPPPRSPAAPSPHPEPWPPG